MLRCRHVTHILQIVQAQFIICDFGFVYFFTVLHSCFEGAGRLDRIVVLLSREYLCSSAISTIEIKCTAMHNLVNTSASVQDVYIQSDEIF